MFPPKTYGEIIRQIFKPRNCSTTFDPFKGIPFQVCISGYTCFRARFLGQVPDIPNHTTSKN